MCLKLKGIDAETFRKHLLEKYGVGVIADGERDIRVAFSAVEAGELEDLFALDGRGGEGSDGGQRGEGVRLSDAAKRRQIPC